MFASIQADTVTTVTFFIDTLSVLLLLLIVGLLAVVLRFAGATLEGDPGRRRFLMWLGLTGAAVMLLVVSGNLLQFALAWSATSLLLHRLLVFYPNRPGALLAARKKFIVSRLGDACLAVVLVLTWREFGTWDFVSLFDRAAQMATQPSAPSAQVQIIGLLLAAGAMLKSAQFPFHSWLPDTMETPTPVSALMHAGIINAGGFLVIRMSPILTLSPWAMTLLAVVGAFTALFAALVMLTQASVKRGLAFSTIAQMGFMMLECGLGAFDLAMLHLIAHSLYKAHAFLASGSVVGARAASPAPVPMLSAIAAAGASVGATLLAARLLHLDAAASASSFILVGIFTTALATLVAHLWTVWSWQRALAGVGVAFAMAAAYSVLHHAAGLMMPSAATTAAPLGTIGMITTVAVLTLLFALNIAAPRFAQWPAVRTLYVHARNGFYLNTLANRFATRLWPLQPTTKELL